MDAPAPLPEAPASTDAPGTVREFVVALLEALHTRLELAGIELEIHVRAVLRSLVWSVGAVACAMLGVACGVVALIVALWDTHRIGGLHGAGGDLRLPGCARTARPSWCTRGIARAARGRRAARAR